MAARSLCTRPGASPGLLRRRYSAPETVMRKYRLAQLTSDTEDSVPATARSPPRDSCSPCDAGYRFARGDSALVRRAALMRRAWGQPELGEPPPDLCARATRSLHGSRADLRANSKRQRLDPVRDFQASGEMLRAAMRNSYERAARAEPAAGCANGRDVCFVQDTAAQSGSSDTHAPHAQSRSCSMSESAARDTFTTWTRKPANHSSDHSASRGSERSVSEHENYTGLPTVDAPLALHAPRYDLLEVAVSETLVPAATAHSPGARAAHHQTLKAPSVCRRSTHNVNIDEYVSNILVESLHSLSDRLECMNAAIGNDRRISVVEKEIKVKLQNTGVNTVVHLSPTSNHQIIFGNRELYHSERRDSVSMPEEPVHVQTDDNLTSAPRTADCDASDIENEHGNAAVLQQIQKLFQDELQTRDSESGGRARGALPEVAHVEISDVDVFIEDNGAAPVEMVRVRASRPAARRAPITGVGAANYAEEHPVVPRFSALPHTDSMEVNTSSDDHDDAEPLGSDCTSLVDSLDDPNSPRSVSLRRSLQDRRSELVRSAMNVLDLLPENERHEQPKDKGEAFFVTIKEDERECNEENAHEFSVAERMPDTIRRRLRRRQRDREQRAARARRARADRAPARAERDCLAIVHALIDDVIAKVAQDEYKCMRIGAKPAKMVTSKSDENVAIRRSRKDLDTGRSLNTSKFGVVRFESSYFQRRRRREDGNQVRGKLSLATHPTPVARDREPKRVYQKSEIREGQKCIEILEILEYVNEARSSPESAASDENHNHTVRHRKSRIPVPVHDRSQRPAADGPPAPRAPPDRNGNEPPPRSRSSSLRFTRTFDVIPEEKSSLSVESGSEDINHQRRASAPGAVGEPSDLLDGGGGLHGNNTIKNVKNASTSPLAAGSGDARGLRFKNQTTMTSPGTRSAATSPPRARPGCAPRDEGISPSAPCTLLPLPHRTAASVPVE